VASPPYKSTGRPQAHRSRAQANGVIRVEFELVHEALAWIYQQLQIHSPVLTGLCQCRFVRRWCALSERAPPENIPEYQPYARKIKATVESRPRRRKVFTRQSRCWRRKFGRLGKIRFSYRTPIGGPIVGGRVGDRSKRRTPAIIVTLR
jgi:hypothetical protein